MRNGPADAWRSGSIGLDLRRQAAPQSSIRATHLSIVTAFAGVTVWLLLPGRVEAMSMRGQRRWRPYAYPLKVLKPKPPPRDPQEEERLDFEEALHECEEAHPVHEPWARALELMARMQRRGLERRTSSWMSAARTCAQSGRWVEATWLLRSMQNETIHPDQSMYNVAIGACLDEGPYQHAVELSEQMKRSGLAPNLESYTNLIGVLAKRGQLEDAEALYQEAHKLGFFEVWVQNGRNLNLQDLPIEIGELILRKAIQERACNAATRKAGRGGFNVLTGPEPNKKKAYKQKAMVRVLREEFGLKVRVFPTEFGRIELRGTELQRLGKEILEEH